MTLPMPPCFDCGKKLVKGNVRTVTNVVMKRRPDYDYRLDEKDPHFFKTHQDIEKGMITVCDGCDMERDEKFDCPECGGIACITKDMVRCPKCQIVLDWSDE
jgi:hypothetical protein